MDKTTALIITMSGFAVFVITLVVYLFWKATYKSPEQLRKEEELEKRLEKEAQEKAKLLKEKEEEQREKLIADYIKNGGQVYHWDGFNLTGSMLGYLSIVGIIGYFLYEYLTKGDYIYWPIIFLLILFVPLWYFNDKYSDGQTITESEKSLLSGYNIFLKLIAFLFVAFLVLLAGIFLSEVRITATTIIIILLLIIIYNQSKSKR